MEGQTSLGSLDVPARESLPGMGDWGQRRVAPLSELFWAFENQQPCCFSLSHLP